jgi:leader peptidase (prepilin peptidase)/N-methyltransferase
MGDVKLAGPLGAYLGWLGATAALAGLMAAWLLAAVTGLGLMAAGRANRKTHLPFVTLSLPMSVDHVHDGP